MPEPGRVVVAWSTGSDRALADRLTRREAAALLRVPADELHLVRVCPRCGASTHGRPTLGGTRRGGLPSVSIGRAAGLTVVAVSTAGPVGVDVERSGAGRLPRLGEVAEHPLERRGGGRDLTRTWVRKESLLKATGQGLAVDPREVRVSAAGEPAALVGWDAPGAPAGPVRMYDVDLTPGVVAAVTVLAADPPRLTVRRAAEEAPPPTASGRRGPPAAGR